jgi:hypothetical protein
MERRLAAILAADVVGYTRLMEQDEADVFTRLRAHRTDLFEPQVEAYRGRIFKLMGDGLLAEYASVVDAVECAVALQREMAERETDIPEERRIRVRIGVNLGDVIVDGDDRLERVLFDRQRKRAPGGALEFGRNPQKFYWTTSPWIARSMPSRSVSVSMRRPSVTSSALRMISVATAQ